MLINGTKIAEEIKTSLKTEIELVSKKEGEFPNITLGVILVGENPVSVKYVDKKKILGEDIGVSVKVFHFDENVSEDELMKGVNKLVLDSDGVIIQLPLPKHIETQKILNLVPGEKDVDCLSEACLSEGVIFSPVVEATKEILRQSNVSDLNSMNAVVVGRGRLVGKPAFEWLKKEGANAQIFGKDGGDNMANAILHADLLILSAGQPGLIKPEMVKDGVILIDASTSEVSGVLKGDATPGCASKCSIFTPVPGGVGPLTVVMLFRNLIELYKRGKHLK